MSSSRDARAGRLVAVAAALVVGSGAPPAGAAPPPACELVLVSPAFQRDRTLVCVHRAHSQAPRTLAVSRDGGRTWRVPAMTGLARPGDVTGIPLTAVLSPAFGEDGTLFAATASGTYLSTDRGETFAPLDALAPGGGAEDNPVAFLAAPPPIPGVTGERRVPHLAYGSARGPAVVDVATRAHRPVVGVPGLGALRFVMPAAATAPAGALALVNEPDASSGGSHLALYRCDASLACAERLHAFPDGVALTPDGWVRRLPDGSLVALLGVRVWRSTDGGRTFALWQPVARLVPPVAGGVAPAVSIAANGALPRRLFLRVETARPPGGWTAGSPPQSQVFRSDDGGTSWRRVAFRRAVGQAGARGNAPWTVAGRGNDRAHLQLAPDGRLLAAGGTESAMTTFCSLDGGVRWSVGCPR